jgi:hypothetical protein
MDVVRADECAPRQHGPLVAAAAAAADDDGVPAASSPGPHMNEINAIR